MLIDEREAYRRGLKLRPPLKIKKRRMGTDNFNWREDPVRPQKQSCLAGGYKSIKHKWLCQYLQATQDQATIKDASRELGVEKPEARQIGEDIHSETEERGRRKSGNALVQGKNRKSQGAEQALENEAAKFRKQAESEIRASREEDARKHMDSSLANEKIQIATKKARKEAEDELKLAAEQDRGAMAQKSLLKELAQAETPKSPRAGSINRNGNPLQRDTGASKRNSESKINEKKSMKQRPMSSPGLIKPSPEKVPGKKDPLSGHKRQSSEFQGKPASSQIKISEKRKRSGISSQSKEDVAENEGKTKQRVTSPEWRGQKSTGFANFANQSNAIDSHPLVQVTFIEGSEREHLGELDLHQLDSFRDLWLTIRSAFSARLPRGDFKLVYRDIDNDLMIHKSEPWDYFKAAASSLLLISKGSNL